MRLLNLGLLYLRYFLFGPIHPHKIARAQMLEGHQCLLNAQLRPRIPVTSPMALSNHPSPSCIFPTGISRKEHPLHPHSLVASPPMEFCEPLSALLACRKELIGIILVKELILVDKETSTRVGELKMRSAPQLRADTRLYDMLRLFATGRCHMAVLVQPPAQSTPRPETGVFAVACFGSVRPGQITHSGPAICLSCCLFWPCCLFWRLAAARAIHPAAQHGCVHHRLFWLHCLLWHCCLFWRIACVGCAACFGGVASRSAVAYFTMCCLFRQA